MQDSILMIITALGGLGLFLLGMIVMTQGLRELAGDAIRNALMRFTHTSVSGVITGAVSTALLQSSSATTVAAVGFVAAGLMSYTAALGIVFGANLGTTVTGWLVALVGFKLKIGMLAMPMVLAGAMLRMFGDGRIRASGFALAGFGLIFVGISAMQEGMANLQGIITPETLPGDTVTGRLLIVLMGLAVTVITQSSSAGVAATMTALHAGAISFEQGLALIIGMDIGTTVTALLATIGATRDARRTGFSHMIYNLMTASLALLLITPYVSLVSTVWTGALQTNAEISLVAFHSLFNLVGIMLILPFTGPFIRLLYRLVPAQKPRYRYPEEQALLESPALALAEVQKSVVADLTVLLRHIEAILTRDRTGQRGSLDEMQLALDQTHEFLDHIHASRAEESDWAQLMALVHLLDHLQRLHERCEEDEDRAITAREKAELREMHDTLLQAVRDAINALHDRDWAALVNGSRAARREIVTRIEPVRETIAEKITSGEMDVQEATGRLEAIRWIDRVSNHLVRTSVHLQRSTLALAAREM